MALKITRYSPLLGDATNGYYIFLTIGAGPGARKHRWSIEVAGDPLSSVPLPLSSIGREDLWVCKGYVFRVEDAEFTEHEELILRIKHAALAEQKELKRIEREVQAFENIQATATARRERIPDDVKLFVWQRDEGKCVRCGSNERLEFDHIIPVIEGGANTTRNIQLLCERCNRQKGRSI